MSNGEYEYDAFISYRHLPLDKTIAEKLEILLESYKPPKKGVYSRTNRIKKIFRDTSELQTSGDLGGAIKKALEQSAFLIVICSERTVESLWCMEEIEYFKSLHGGKCSNILTVVVSGEPNKVFPESLRYEVCETISSDGEVVANKMEIEPLAANVAAKTTSKSLRLLKQEFLRIVAPILGCGYDDLYRRHQRRKSRRMVQAVCAALLFVLAIGIYIMFSQRQIFEQRFIAESEKKIRTLNIAENMINSNEKLLASAVLLELFDKTQEHDDYTNSEIERLLCKSIYMPEYKQYAALRKDDAIYDCVFSEDGSVFFTACANGDVDMWNPKNGMLLKTFKHNTSAIKLLVQENTLYVVTANSLAVWDIQTGRKTAESNFGFNKSDYFEYYSAQYSEYSDFSLMVNDSQYIIVYCATLIVGDIKSGKYEIYDYKVLEDLKLIALDRTRFLCLFAFANTEFECAILDPVAQTEVDYSCGLNSMNITDCKYNEESGEFIALTHGDDMQLLKMALNGSSEMTQIKMPDEANENSYSYFTICDFTSDNSMLTIGNFFGEAIYIDFNNQRNNSFNDNYPKNAAADFNQMKFINDDLIFIARYDSMPAFWERGHRLNDDIPNTYSTANYECAVSDSTLVLCDTYGNILLIGRGKSDIEQSVEMDIDIHDYDPFVSFIGSLYSSESLEAVSADGKYRFIKRTTNEKPKYFTDYNESDNTYESYWMEDVTTGELLYNCNIPFAFSFIDIKDSETGTPVDNSGYMYTVNLRTGEVYSKGKLGIGFDNFTSTAQFVVDYERNRANIIFDVYRGQAFNGYIVSTDTYQCLFEFSEASPLLLSDRTGRTIYKGDYAYDFLVTKVEPCTVVAYTLPVYEELLDIARKQIGGRTIRQAERDFWGLP